MGDGDVIPILARTTLRQIRCFYRPSFRRRVHWRCLLSSRHHRCGLLQLVFQRLIQRGSGTIQRFWQPLQPEHRPTVRHAQGVFCVRHHVSLLTKSAEIDTDRYPGTAFSSSLPAFWHSSSPVTTATAVTVWSLSVKSTAPVTAITRAARVPLIHATATAVAATSRAAERYT